MKNHLFLLLALALFSCELEDPARPGALVPLTVEEDPALPSLALNGTLLHLETLGDPNDPIIVVIHGGPGADYRSMLDAKAFADDGFFVVFYDQRGAGLSQRHDREAYKGLNLTDLMIEDLDALIGHFRQDDQQAVLLLGHSWGGMLASGYINRYPEKIQGAILAEPGGLTWSQTEDYLSRSNQIRIFSEALNDALFPEKLFAGRDEHEVLDYKASYFASYENGPGNAIGNPGPYPFWRNGAVVFDELIDYAEENDFDFMSGLQRFEPKILFAYSAWNEAYGLSWAEEVSAPYPNVELVEVAGTGHEILYFGWEAFYPLALDYLNQLK